MENYLVIGMISFICVIAVWWGGSFLPGERWQFFASIPMRKGEDGSWDAVNITWYGLILSGSAVFALALYLVMMAGAGVSAGAGLCLMAALLAVCVPASSLVARIVERKPATLTIGGAAFVGVLAAPFAIMALNRFIGPVMGESLPPGQTLAACSVSFLFGEGMGRLACLSYGCCYGKPVEEYRGLIGLVFEKTAVIFHGKTKKIAYASNLEGHRVVPIQSVTMLASFLAGIVTLTFYASGHCLAAYIGAATSAGTWRIVSELFRNDYRGGGRVSAYQVMSGLSIIYVGGVALFLGDGSVVKRVNLLNGFGSLWNPGVLVFLLAVWIMLVLFTGVSSTTYSQVRFHLHREKL